MSHAMTSLSSTGRGTTGTWRTELSAGRWPRTNTEGPTPRRQLGRTNVLFSSPATGSRELIDASPTSSSSPCVSIMRRGFPRVKWTICAGRRQIRREISMARDMLSLPKGGIGRPSTPAGQRLNPVPAEGASLGGASLPVEPGRPCYLWERLYSHV